MWNFARLCLLIKKSASLFFLLRSELFGKVIYPKYCKKYAYTLANIISFDHKNM